MCYLINITTKKKNVDFIYHARAYVYTPCRVGLTDRYLLGHFHFGRFSIENTGARNANVAPCTIGNLCVFNTTYIEVIL